MRPLRLSNLSQPAPLATAKLVMLGMSLVASAFLLLTALKILYGRWRGVWLAPVARLVDNMVSERAGRAGRAAAAAAREHGLG